MPRILLVDDDAALLDVLTLAFSDAGHTVHAAADGSAALARLRTGAPLDAIVSDVNMTGVDGFALCRKLRAEGNPIPLVLLTSRDTEIDEALGLELGADDYISKPFSTRILLARVDALLRRDALRRAAASSARTLRAGDLTLDSERLEAHYRGELLRLTVTEFRLLEALAGRPGIVLSRDRLLEIVRGDESVVVERIIDTYVRRLRRKFEAIDPAYGGIETVIGAGYRFRA
jgi:DNA-binding response OmpR family regulator